MMLALSVPLMLVQVLPQSVLLYRPPCHVSMSVQVGVPERPQSGWVRTAMYSMTALPFRKLTMLVQLSGDGSGSGLPPAVVGDSFVQVLALSVLRKIPASEQATRRRCVYGSVDPVVGSRMTELVRTL